jgi:hypothetical protein
MSDLNDESLQQWLEFGESSGKADVGKPSEPDDFDESSAPGGFSAEEIEDYRQLFALLDETRPDEAPPGFAAHMVVRIEALQERKALIRSVISSFLVVAAIVGILYGVLHALLAVTGSPFLQTLLGLKWAIAMTLGMILAIQFLDERLVKNRLFKTGRPVI